MSYGPITFEVVPEGVNLYVNDIFIARFDGVSALETAKSMQEAADLWEKHYRAFVHDETRTVH